MKDVGWRLGRVSAALMLAACSTPTETQVPPTSGVLPAGVVLLATDGKDQIWVNPDQITDTDPRLLMCGVSEEGVICADLDTRTVTMSLPQTRGGEVIVERKITTGEVPPEEYGVLLEELVAGPDGVITPGRQPKSITLETQGKKVEVNEPTWVVKLNQALVRAGVLAGVALAENVVSTATAIPTLPEPTATEIAKSYTPEQMRAVSDEDLMAVAKRGAESLTDPNFSGNMKAGEVVRGGEGNLYRYDFVTLTDQSDLIVGVYSVDTGNILHAVGGRYVKDGKVGPLVLVVTDNSSVESDKAYLALNEQIGPKDDPSKQITDPKLIMEALVKTVTQKRAFVRFWNEVLDAEVDDMYINAMSYEGGYGGVTSMNNEERFALAERAMGYYLDKQDEKQVILIAKTNKGKTWEVAGYDGNQIVKEDFSLERMSYVVEYPSLTSGKVVAYLEKMPPGGAVMLWIHRIGGSFGFGGGFWYEDNSQGLEPSVILPEFCNGVINKDDRGVSWREFYNYYCATRSIPVTK